jgi:serine phosphatase RsbU (regulator of sigma subunit)
VGGDYYDAIRVGDSSVAIAVGDVSGKGMGAALLMSNLQAIVRLDQCSAGHNPPILARRDGALETRCTGRPVPGVFPGAS